MKKTASSLYQQVVNSASSLGPTGQLPAEYTRLKAEAEELKNEATVYLSAQLTLQFISTAAMVGMFYLAYKASKRRH